MGWRDGRRRLHDGQTHPRVGQLRPSGNVDHVATVRSAPTLREANSSIRAPALGTRELSASGRAGPPAPAGASRGIFRRPNIDEAR